MNIYIYNQNWCVNLGCSQTIWWECFFVCFFCLFVCLFVRSFVRLFVCLLACLLACLIPEWGWSHFHWLITASYYFFVGYSFRWASTEIGGCYERIISLVVASNHISKSIKKDPKPKISQWCLTLKMLNSRCDEEIGGVAKPETQSGSIMVDLFMFMKIYEGNSINLDDSLMLTAPFCK